MEYEIYLLCNILGVVLVAIIILFHFVEADEGQSHPGLDAGEENEQSKVKLD